MIYFDADFVAKFYLDEPESEAVRSLATEAREVACCRLGRVETLSVFHRKLREQIVTTTGYKHLCEQFESDCRAGLWQWLPMSAALLEDTVSRVRQLPASVFLRAGDAIHLTCAKDRGLQEIHSNDRHLLAAAPHFGLKGVNILPS